MLLRLYVQSKAEYPQRQLSKRQYILKKVILVLLSQLSLQIEALLFFLG